MMYHRNANGRVNVKLLAILIVLVAAVGASLVVARQIRRRALSERALAAGQTAFEKQDWRAAVTNFGVYLGRNPDDLPVLRKYAESVMSTRPRDGQAVTRMITQAISAYRHILRLDPHDGTASEQLAKLYGSVLNFEELIPIAKTRMEHDPNDLNAPLWLAELRLAAAFRGLADATTGCPTLEAFANRPLADARLDPTTGGPLAVAAGPEPGVYIVRAELPLPRLDPSRGPTDPGPLLALRCPPSVP